MINSIDSIFLKTKIYKDLLIKRKKNDKQHK